MTRYLLIILCFFLVNCNGQEKKSKPLTNQKMDKNNLEYATLAGGCFWCVESCFHMLKGVDSVTSGYSGGHKDNPTYEEVCTGTTGHAEVVEIALIQRLFRTNNCWKCSGFFIILLHLTDKEMILEHNTDLLFSTIPKNKSRKLKNL